MRRNTSTYLAGILCASGLLFLGPDRLCHGGGLLPFQFDPDGPMISTASGSLSYDASTGEFSGSVVPLALSSALLPGSGVATFSSDSRLRFDFFVNPDGTFRSDPDGFNLTGTLTLNLPDGTTPRISGTLLSGDFYAFGAEPEGPPTWVANALMDPTGGQLSTPQTIGDGFTLPALFPIGGAPVGIVFSVADVAGGTLGDFTRSFSSDSVGAQVGAASVPEPASAMLGMLAIAVLGLSWFATAACRARGGASGAPPRQAGRVGSSGGRQAGPSPRPTLVSADRGLVRARSAAHRGFEGSGAENMRGFCGVKVILG
jgi:hypothetical protein